ncbi:N-acetylmuramoyl-L-alanine amidase [Fulvimarina sp. 2208YS6-2-32]|uniref:N-acetylmuramoyl-L-alanine amidase n=1 Tax=Fulvimarina uroteuthidis TaxID=3098149 RepID=A0ABU5I5Z9_9HYPH|nr:N-acetylmuramoyl-L-alanine amidase [Fulvimarina sp. 2208YS6-2-32]MDY8110636.1 N-acetylmuramoyl-L-alanine amidase [Fulvimarina sp. 2208YS6-2-32]
MISLVKSAAAETAIVMRVEVQAGAADRQSVVLTFTSAPDARLVVLRSPDRIALDLTDALPASDPELPDESGLIESVRHGATGPDRYRYIFRPREGVEARLDRLTVPEGEGAAYEIRFSRSHGESVVAGKAQLGAKANADVAEGASAATSEAVGDGAEFTVVIDPGHGGEDNGAIAKNGAMEKDVNLAAAKALRDALSDNPNVRVVMTREEDVFVGLFERSRIARRENANLFISLHADSIRYENLRGATIYTLSERASDRLSLEIANNENAADRFGDAADLVEAPEVFDILSDLTRRETVGYSEHFAASLLSEMKRSNVRMIKNPKRSASFLVLKSPDVPSVLIELGFMSNDKDAKLLADEEWRRDTMKTIANAITAFYGL